MKGKNQSRGFKHLTWWFVIIGAINWGLVGLFEFDLVQAIFGFGSSFTDIIYILIGVAGLSMLYGCCGKHKCKCGMNGKEGCVCK